ncbi:MAG: type I DNA topoisomerase [Lachnospiraceae bacterium]|nr:type I DNA topoisomerase [Lachnospiraceae bacterium]
MDKKLVIVESPAKVKTIKKFMGANYTVMASGGHVRDLPKSRLGINTNNDYEPEYITIRGKGEVLAALRKEVKKSSQIYLATDPDREGEAISWHLMYALKLGDSGKKVSRITFNEITKSAVRTSLKNAREIDMNLVDAQQARRCLDRVVGYRISPLLWEKIKRGLSAGRVQSVALRIICDREDEINAFIPKEYWTIDATLSLKGEKNPINAHYWGDDSGKREVNDKAEADRIVKAASKEKFTVKEVKTGTRVRKAPLPYTTSTLQQDASNRLNMSPYKTMSIAQQLYEDGIITYLRTDSVRVAYEAVVSAGEFIREKYGEPYAVSVEEEKKGDSGRIQDAHEAIRPTDITRLPEDIKDSLSRDQFRLYRLIWQRFTASRMTNAVYSTMSAKISAGKEIFTMSASNISFDGFLKLWTPEDNEKSDPLLKGGLEKGDVLSLKAFDPKQHFTSPPPRYTEAGLVRAMEEMGIGRPSTYAPTISTLVSRHYVTKEEKNLFVTELGDAVNGIMKREFPEIVDVNFTANMETLLDGVEMGSVKWKTIIENFYPDLDAAVEKARKELENIKVADEETDVVCEECGRKMVVKYGPYGKFLACPGFPECRNTKPFFEKIGVACPKCGNDIVIRRSKKGRRYYGCLGYPDCDFVSWQRPVDKSCPKCGKIMVIKGKKIVCSDRECGYSEPLPENDD